MKYRPDIDGLRAIAVGSVVLYHLNEPWLPGGFVGVDVFFVISGYLITRLIHEELVATGDFSFRHFYLRRVRRLFPALFFTLLLTLTLGYQLFSPAHLTELSQSLVAAVLSVSNFFFWSVAGYFDSDSAMKPLLHTWSLSIEEQFYLIWPALLFWLFMRRKRGLIPAFIITMGVASLLFNIVFFAEQVRITSWFGTRDNQSVLDIHSTAFYMLPFRVFEFAIGAILVWMPNLGQAGRRYLAESSFGIGLVMIIYSAITFTSKTEFPSSAALLPCLGAALMMLAGPRHRLVTLVSNPVMVGLGLISYSLYLIHWPFIVFYCYWNYEALVWADFLLILLASVTAAWLMYRFVEQPFRRPRVDRSLPSPNRKFLFGTLGSALMLVMVSAHASISGGWPKRYPPDVLAQLSYQKGDYTEYFWHNLFRLERGFSGNGKPKVLVIGDSMAADFVNVLIEGGTGNELDLATIAIGENCKAVFPLSDSAYRAIFAGAAERCRKQHDKVLSQTELLAQADTIVLASYWWEVPLIQYVDTTAQYLAANSDAQIMVLGLKNQESNGIRFLSKHSLSAQIHKIRTPLHPHAGTINRLLQQNAAHYRYFDLVDRFCNTQGCQRVTEQGYVIVFDDAHFSEQGARFVGQGVDQAPWFHHLTTARQ